MKEDDSKVREFFFTIELVSTAYPVLRAVHSFVLSENDRKVSIRKATHDEVHRWQ